MRQKNKNAKKKHTFTHRHRHRKLSVSLHISRLTAQPVFTYSFAHARRQTNNVTIPNIHTLSFRLHKSWLLFSVVLSLVCLDSPFDRMKFVWTFRCSNEKNNSIIFWLHEVASRLPRYPGTSHHGPRIIAYVQCTLQLIYAVW